MKPAFFLISFLFFSCGEPETEPNLKCFKVTATAYNSLPYQTTPGTEGNITAWGDTLYPGMKSIAISRDLLDSGLVHGARVLVEGFEGDTFVVNDKTHHRYRSRIDLYMGKDVKAAKNFGRKKLWICLITENSVTTENE